MAHFVQTPLGKAHYHHRGIGKSRLLVVMIAGIGHDPSYWPELLESVGKEYEVIAIDMFGRGGSDAGSGPYDAEGCAAYVEAVLNALGLAGRPRAMCGFSFGGAVAAQVAAFSEVVVGALLFVPAGVAVSPTFGAGIKMTRQLPRGVADGVGVLGSIGGLFCFGRTGRTEATTEPGYAARAERVWWYSLQDFFLNPSFFRAYMHTLRDFPLGAADFNLRRSFRHLKHLGSRVEIVVATGDTIIPAAEVKAFVAAELTEARMLEVCGGHDVQWDRPAQTSEVILRFLRALEPELVCSSQLGASVGRA